MWFTTATDEICINPSHLTERPAAAVQILCILCWGVARISRNDLRQLIFDVVPLLRSTPGNENRPSPWPSFGHKGEPGRAHLGQSRCHNLLVVPGWLHAAQPAPDGWPGYRFSNICRLGKLVCWSNLNIGLIKLSVTVVVMAWAGMGLDTLALLTFSDNN